jgi:signal transduction histidine kinase
MGVRIHAERHALAARWLERLVAVIPVEPTDVFPTETLLDHIPNLIEEIAKSLAAPDHEIAGSTFVVAKARELGELRHAQRASVHQLLREYELLRSILETFVGEEAQRLSLQPALPEVLKTVQHINRAVALLTQTTVDTFVERFTATIHDQTKRLAAFNTMVSHELRQPLAALQTGSALLRQTVADKDIVRRQRLVESVDRNVSRLVELVATITRMTAGPVPDDTKPGVQKVPLTTVAQEAARQLREMAGARDVRIRIAPDLPDAIVDVGRLELMLTNLLSNGIKYSDPKKSERFVEVVSSRHDNSDGTFCVRDNGLGMTDAQVQQVFTPFYRAHTDTGVDGLGLGLAIVRDCADAIGASITVASAPGEGTTFTITLPIRSCEPAE